MIKMTQNELMIQDLRNQVGRLSEERAMFFALSTSFEQENASLKKEIEELKNKGAEKNED